MQQPCNQLRNYQITFGIKIPSMEFQVNQIRLDVYHLSDITFKIVTGNL